MPSHQNSHTNNNRPHIRHMDYPRGHRRTTNPHKHQPTTYPTTTLNTNNGSNNLPPWDGLPKSKPIESILKKISINREKKTSQSIEEHLTSNLSHTQIKIQIYHQHALTLPQRYKLQYPHAHYWDIQGNVAIPKNMLPTTNLHMQWSHQWPFDTSSCSLKIPMACSRRLHHRTKRPQEWHVIKKIAR